MCSACDYQSVAKSRAPLQDLTQDSLLPERTKFPGATDRNRKDGRTEHESSPLSAAFAGFALDPLA